MPNISLMIRVTGPACDRRFSSLICFLLINCQPLIQSSREMIGPNQPRIQIVIDYIHAHLDSELSISTLARLMQVSPFHFIRLFKRTMGITPHSYIMKQRIERAKVLLKGTNLSVAEIAYDIGFCSQSRFTTVFSQYVQTSPTAYRKQQFNVATEDTASGI